MRVIAGSARRLQLKTPEGMDTRPTADRVKESLFNMLNPDLNNCRFLDLFSGSGAIAIEALSRGAEEAVLVDFSPSSIEVIKQNLSFTKLEEKAKVMHSDIYTAIKSLGYNGDKFDIIFMDPPYAEGFYEPVLKAVKDADILAEDGYIVVETAKGSTFPTVEGFNRIKERKCGPAVMRFLNLEEERC